MILPELLRADLYPLTRLPVDTLLRPGRAPQIGEASDVTLADPGEQRHAGKTHSAGRIHTIARLGDQPLMVVPCEPWPPISSKASSSATPGELSPAPMPSRSVSWRPPVRAPCCWMKSTPCRWRRRPVCCASSRPANSSRSAPTRRNSAACSHHRRQQHEPGRRRRSRPISARPVLPAQRDVVRPAAVARETAGHRVAGSRDALCLAQKFGKSLTSIGAKAPRVLQTSPWPGNIRQLENVLQQAVLVSSGPELLVAISRTPYAGNHDRAVGAGPGSFPRIDCERKAKTTRVPWPSTGPRANGKSSSERCWTPAICAAVPPTPWESAESPCTRR